MSEGAVVVDTSVIILLVATDREDAETLLRRERAEEAVARLARNGSQFVVPAPVVAELHRDGPGHLVAQRVFERLGGMRIEAFDHPAATAAGEILKTALAMRAPGDTRAVMKFDALIAGTAHAIHADRIITANARDFSGLLGRIASPVIVERVDAIPEKGQLRTIDVPPR